MTKRPDRVRRVERSGADIYFKKATEFLNSMRHAMQTEQWNAVGLNAVHCAISACDAVLVRFTQRRSASPDHDAAATLLRSLADVPDAKQKAETFLRILDEKNLIEYEDHSLALHDAAELVKLTERFYRWAEGLLKD